MRRLILAGLIAGVFFSCSSAIERYPLRRCLFDSQRRFWSGQIVAAKHDGSKLFKFDDPSAGDDGYAWIDETTSGRRFGPCPQSSAYDASRNQPEVPHEDETQNPPR
ncbi:MAG TPA: hypothetical protein VNL91_04225 [Thermoanaerobaculia bacterium]|nr:hypothetical protein [Thermoanaerobaculia bacterium]